jgi:hypothetical protein
MSWLVINADFTDFIDHNGSPQIMPANCFGQPDDQRGLARAQKPSNQKQMHVELLSAGMRCIYLTGLLAFYQSNANSLLLPY